MFLGEKMRNKEKIKVFISSKCGGERINFDELVRKESSDKKNLADTAIRTNYDLVRRALKVALENTGFIETYIFEDDTASTSTSRDDYLFKLDQSDICLFLIDNFDKDISRGILIEVERAKQTNKKSIYLFLKDRKNEDTDLQKNLTGPAGVHYHEIYDIREFIDAGYQAVLGDIIETYQKYCRGYLVENKAEIDSVSVEIIAGNFSADTSDIDKKIFKNLELTKSKIANLFYRHEEKDVQTSDLDKSCLSILEYLLGEKNFNDIELNNLLDVLKTIHPPRLHEFVKQRWSAIASYFNGDVISALSITEAAYNVFSEDPSIPKWLINDVLIDWRNLKTVDDQTKNVYDFSVQEKINQQNSIIFFPLIDRFSTNVNQDIWDRNFKITTGSPYSTTYYNLEHLFGYITNYLFTAIYYGSYTHIISTLKEIHKALFDVVQKENNLLHKLQLMRINILRGEESGFDNIVRKYGSSLAHSTTREILELYELSNRKPLQHEKIKWKLILFRELGYYFSDADYENISNELFDFSREWISEGNSSISLGEKFLKSLKTNIRRLSQERVTNFAMEILDKKYYRFFNPAFDILSEVDFSNLSKEIIKRLLSQIDLVLSDEDKKRDYQHVKNLLIKFRKGQNYFITEIDHIAEKYYPEFYKEDYNLEVFPEKRDAHIPRYIDSIKVRNNMQGKDGSFIVYVDRPYITIRKIIEIEKPSLPKELLDDLLGVIFKTLCLETQTHAEKIDSIELMLTLKRQKLPYIYNWNEYYSKIEQFFSKMEKGYSGFFLKDETLSLRLHLLFIRIAFNKDCLQELLEILALLNSSEEYEIISSLDSIRDFLSLEVGNLIGEPVMPVLLQYISAFCFHESHDVRYHTVQSLYLLIESQYTDFVINRLSKMMDDDDYRVRWAILNQVSTIKKINELTYNYIVGKAQIDNNYLVKRLVGNYTQPI